ncbi:uncharacterized protein (TIGR03086 family) [Tamaricihabitans halophyticus]|uniref:Uncharacterized protein (TIGR03086 family) n=1 Tax=Tamaricihabitans halophyticus TaxID=1262583 RepID=A0A4R2QN16_9PSEU|nr:TIGR03086 family metal-binding protein [Tamaricihabitans halophyticus]TCP50837.1 uncharacterized protein (TIGR03086 family) [Tamaricihabitans halophyticus]
MRLLEAHGMAMAAFDRVVHEVTEPQWTLPTPCSDWNAGDLVNHLVAEQLWAPWLLRGYTLAEVGDRFDGWLLGDDPVTAWEQASAVAHAAWRTPGALDGDVHVTGGQLPAETYGWQMTSDLAVHSWDLAMSIDASQPIEPELATVLLAQLEPQRELLVESGLFHAPVQVPDSATEPERLLALLGRDPAKPLG